MVLDRIEKLLEKYFAAATTILEEKELKDYFASSNVAPTLDQYKPIFVYAVQAKKEQFIAPVTLKNNKRDSSSHLAVTISLFHHTFHRKNLKISKCCSYFSLFIF